MAGDAEEEVVETAGPAGVVTITARKSNMPVYLRGLGTATAFNTVRYEAAWMAS